MPREALRTWRRTCEILERNNSGALCLGFTRSPVVNLVPDRGPGNEVGKSGEGGRQRGSPQPASVFSDKILSLSLGLELH